MAQSGVLRVPRVQLIRGLARTKETANLSADSQQSLPHVSSTAGRAPREKINRNQLVCWGDDACEAELGDLACEAAGLGFGRGASKMVWAEILVEGAVAKHVIGGGQDRGRDGADGLLG